MGTWTIPGFADNWRVPGYAEERVLGQGASGRVVAAVSVATGKRVAIKYLSSALVSDPTFTWRFREEAELQRSLDVPQIVRVLDYAEEPGRGAAIVMELVDGVSLHEMIGQRGPASPEAALAVLKGSLLGLAAAHAAGIVHRDYKPENVLVDAEGSSKLADFGVAVLSGKLAPTAGTPLYMAPEQWNGAPSSPATDIYAVAAVFFECLTGKAPFSGRLPELRQQHETAAVPLDAITAPALRSLITRGMAKDPAGRPQDAIAFVSQLELVATAAYGADWEERGRGHLAVRAAALLPLLLTGGGVAGSSGTSTASSWLGGHKVQQAGRQARRLGRKAAHARRKAVAIGAAAVVVAAAAALAVALTGHKAPTARLTGSSSVASTSLPAVQAAVLPPVAASHCTAPSSFSYQGTVTAVAPGPVSYRWVYSSGKQGPVQTVDFAEAGQRQVTGETVATRKAGTGWGEIKMISPAASTSNKAGYRLLCASGAPGVSAAASIGPAAKTVTCGSPVPAFTAAGSITSPRAQTVTYYWSLSDGRATAPASMTFSKPGTLPAETLAITPQGDPSSGEAVLVVTSPVAASAPAPYTLSCNVPLHLAAPAAVSPASLSVTPSVAAGATLGLAYSGTVTVAGGKGPYKWAAPTGLPDGLTATGNGATLTISGTPTKPGPFTVGVSVSDGESPAKTATASLPVTVGAPSLSALADAPASATAGQAYSGTVTVTGGQAPYTWAAATGLPDGLTATGSGATLTISGTPTKPGPFTVAVSVSDGESPAKTATASVPVTVSAPPLTVVTASLPSGTTGDDYSAALTASGGTGPYTWSATGLPGGLSIDPATGTISGTLLADVETYDEPGTYPVTVTVRDSTTSTPKQLSLVVSKRPLTLEVLPFDTATSGAAFTAFFWADAGTAPYTWTVTGLPPGLSFGAYSDTEEEITGTPPAVTAPATYQVTVTVTDAAGATLSQAQSLEVDPAPAGG
jgi:serine/threonine-protein kinase